MEKENENSDSKNADEIAAEEKAKAEAEAKAKIEAEEKEKSDLASKNAQLYERTKKAEEKAARALEEVEQLKKSGRASGVDVDEYVNVSKALEGLDEWETKKLAEQAKLTGKTLLDIKASEDFQLLQSAHRVKVEKEKSLDPSNRQVESKKPKTFEDEIDATKNPVNPFEITPEREALLEKKGMWKPPAVRAAKDRIPLS